ncbi:mechanosensitive ion channel family protein [Pseudofulvibacter geojedonensis]|uniref:Mechanosensitive ion channel family protein n=1 Tax=Pseudofulvibacter geojedonensis TaxID=1123758 RepID=A0ABW3HY82_9FLAO
MLKQITSLFNLKDPLSIAVYVFLVVFACWVTSRIARTILIFFLKRNLTKEKIGVTSLKFTRNSLRFIFGLLALAIVVGTIPVFKEKAGYIFSGAGILAAIVGFAAQDALSNLVAGFFIVIFKPFRVGDYIKLDNERSGIVEDITLRHTVINNFENKRLIIPNSIISTESVLNHTIDEAKVLSFNNFLVGLHADIDLAKKIIKEEANKLEFVIDNRKPEDVVKNIPQFDIRVVEVSEIGVQIRAYIWLSEPLWEFKMKCDLKEAVHKRFIAEKVELPIQIRRIIN